MRRLHIVTYDISDNRRWRKVFRKMKGFGQHLQLSVFICDLTPAERVNLRSTLHELIDHSEDKIMIVDLGPSEERTIKEIETIGVPVSIETRHPKVI